MYYLKYRPHTVEDLDNLTPAETIRTILKSKSLPHAFLFIGHKGTGKTSTARIFAKAVNCLSNVYAGKGTSIEPCNVCSNCKSIDKSSFSDVTEMDAASNRGINEVKELIRETSLMPMAGKYRVYIIDEAHMITNDGFNALLKTLEEPPETVIFILATTNLEKVPKTIVSRCVLVQFGSAKIDEIVHMLKRIRIGEKLDISDESLEIIAKHCDLSFRDGAKILEEIALSGKMDPESILKKIGIRSKVVLNEALKKKSPSDTLKWIKEFNASGGNISLLIEELLTDLQNHLLSLHKIPGNISTLSYTLKETIVLMKLLNEAYGLIKQSPYPTIPLEVALLEYCDTIKQ
ncbi:MAG: DNA polymerase III subunit gamma/tau [Candidatus Roizmanbacteria bacterium]|nr:DNA polymerase III subunit gamma/tau [Candidatus Roizmanbacteria bacterium]